MNFSLETAALSSSIALSLLAFSFLYLKTIVPVKKSLGWWAIAFLALSVDNFLVYFHPIDSFGILIPFWEAVHATFVCMTLVGVLFFLGAKINYKLIGLCAVIIIGWGVYSTITKPEFFIQTFPATVLSSGLIFYAAQKLITFRPEAFEASKAGYRFAGWAFAVWALNRLTFSFLLVFPAYGPWGYMISQSAAICMGIGLIVAVLERLRMEAVSNHKQFLRVLETSPVGIAVVEPSSEEILFANSAFQSMARREETIVDWSIKGSILLSSYLKPQGHRSWQQMIKPSLAQGDDARAIEFSSLSWDGQPLWFECSVRKILWEGRVGVQITLVDITERKNSEQALALAKEEAENASEAKTKFLAAASHDLRQPVQALMLFSDTLNALDHTAETNTIVNRIFISLDALRSLLDTLLDISRLEAGLVKPKKSPLSLAKLFSRLEGEFSGQASVQDLTFRYVPSSLNVMSDQILLEDILRNLISNSLKYTDAGKVLLGCRRQGNRVRVEVWDTGQGIPEDQLDMVFKDFHQISVENRKQNRGLGLGLSIVQRLSGLIGAEINVDSTLGQGSVFSVWLDLTDEPVIEENPEISKPDRPNSRLIIAVVDDDIDILESMSKLLLDRGHDVIAFDGVSSEGTGLPAGGDTPDLIIADHSLTNGASGLDAVGQLRHHYGNEIPAIILTGDTSPQKLSELTQTGIPVLHKPVRPSELIDVAERVALKN
ncbi:MAG: ATP-binding protein [Rhodospirillales bacterium]|nr:ATP-binding protein [Rhodospirillales bacterium]